MDEPLSNLDAKLRVQMRTEVSRLQSRLGTTTVYVTHDQTEAMTLGDRVAVMRAGVLQQVGTPAELYDEPGQPLRRRLHRLAGDELPARQRRGRHARLPMGDGAAARRAPQGAGGRQTASGHRRHPPRALRGRRARGRPARATGPTFRAQIDVVESMGSELYAHFALEGEQACVRRARRAGRGRRHGRGARRRRAARSSPAWTPRARSRRARRPSCGSTPAAALFDADSGRNLSAGGEQSGR